MRRASSPVRAGFVGAEVRPGWQCLENSVDGAGGEMVVYDERGDGIPVYSLRPGQSDGVLMEIYVNDVSATPLAAWTYESCTVDDGVLPPGLPVAPRPYVSNA